MRKHKLYPLVLIISLFTACNAPQAITLQPVRNTLSNPIPGVYDLKNVDELPVAVHKEPPIYPSELKRAGVSGSALVQCVVDEQGNVSRVFVIEASDVRFAKAAGYASQQWRFRPAKIAGQPVKCRLNIPWNFSITDE